MQLVVADTGPINYLVLIGRVDILPVLFEHVILPAAVRNELAQREHLHRFRNGLPRRPRGSK